MTLTIKKQLAPVVVLGNSYGYGNKKKFLTIHQTGNTSKGANAQVHANLQSRTYTASWHYQVDDKEAIQSFEHSVSCWHASDGRNDGNLNSIAIEGCINADGNYIKSVTNMAELAAKILKDEGIPIANMKQHHDFDTKNRKNCPAQIRAGKDGIDWNDFVNMVKGFMNSKTVAKPVIAVKSAIVSGTHKVVSGDTLWDIAVKYGTDVQTLKSINGLSSDTIHVGTALKIASTGVKATVVKPVIVVKAAVSKKYNLPTGVYRYVKGGKMKQGNDVLQIQLALSAIYFYPNKGGKNNGNDGWYGSDTANAVKRFQSVNRLKADGIYGNDTRNKLDKIVNK